MQQIICENRILKMQKPEVTTQNNFMYAVFVLIIIQA